jgi:hypothetical protein
MKGSRYLLMGWLLQVQRESNNKLFMKCSSEMSNWPLNSLFHAEVVDAWTSMCISKKNVSKNCNNMIIWTSQQRPYINIYIYIYIFTLLLLHYFYSVSSLLSFFFNFLLQFFLSKLYIHIHLFNFIIRLLQNRLVMLIYFKFFIYNL